jgi:hypothetical protein
MPASILCVLGRDDPAIALYVRPSRPLRLTYSLPGQQQEAQQRQMLGLCVPEAPALLRITTQRMPNVQTLEVAQLRR